MTVNSENLVSMIHRTHDMLKSCEDKVFGKQGLTTDGQALLELLLTVQHEASEYLNPPA